MKNKLEILLDFLNKQPHRYVPISEIEKGLGKDYDSEILTSVTGLSLPQPPQGDLEAIQRYTADLAQVMQTKLVDLWTNHSGEIGYMITLKGSEVLAQIKLTNATTTLKKLTSVLVILTLGLIITNLIQIIK